MKYLLLLLIVISSNLTFATTYYSDPVNGNMSNPGTAISPWSNLEAILNSGQTFNAGDIILLRNGNHGFPKINGVNTGYVDIMAESGHTPMINRIYIGNVSATAYWRLTNLTIQTINISAFPINLITTYPNSSYIVVQNCTIQSTDNTTAYTRNDWRTKSNNGIRSQGTNHIFQNNSIKNIGIGLSIESENTLIKNNEIQFFVTDGIRGLASYCTYEKNVVKDNIVVFTYAENHYDGFQAYTCCPVGTDTIRDVILRQNLIINTTDHTRQWRGPMQGMAGFDGYFENWTIENNVIITDHWHGITLLGAINCRIVNNTVVDPYDVSPIDPYDIESTALHGPGWISIKAHKNGSPSYGNTIRNNFTAAPLNTDAGIGIIDHNLVIGASTNYPANFVDTASFDYRLMSGSVAIDAGISTLAPSIDFDDSVRPQGLNFDLGAFEYASTTYVYYTQNLTICDGESITVGLSTYGLSGNYSDTLNTINPNIDSVVTTVLTVNPLTNSTQNMSICDGESFVIGSSTYTTSGSYTDVLVHPITGCDSTVITNLSIIPLTNSTQNLTICDGESVNVGSSIYTSSGNYSDVLSHPITGCDSTVLTNLIVINSLQTVLDTTICFGETILVGNSIYNLTGNYTDSFTSVNTGCDSIVTTNLIVNPVLDVSVSVTLSEATANMNGVNYNWVDCSNNYETVLVASSNLQTFSPLVAGNYAVILTQNNCTDTSGCVQIETVGLANNYLNSIEIYPNPTYDFTTIKSELLIESITVFNNIGEIIWLTKNLFEHQKTINVGPYCKGIYFVEIKTDTGLITRSKLVIN